MFGYLFHTSPRDTACSLTVSLPLGTTVRTVLLSTRDLFFYEGIGFIVSVGETLATSTRCYFTNYSRATTSSPTGLSAWLTCNNLVGSKLFIINPTYGYVILFEVMAFSQQNLLPIATINSIYSIAAVSGSKQQNLLKKEMKIQSGTISTCYTSESNPSPFITVYLPAAVDI